LADNARKTPTVYSLESHGWLKSHNAVELLGRALPVQVTKIISNQVVQVKFLINSIYTPPEVTMPVATSEYNRLPLQVGAVGAAMPIDVYQGGVSGLGGGTADLSQRANLSTHHFVPMGNKKWSQPDNDTHVIYGGPNGTLLKDADSEKSSITIKKDGVTIYVSNGNITIESSGTLTIKGSTVTLNP